MTRNIAKKLQDFYAEPEFTPENCAKKDPMAGDLAQFVVGNHNIFGLEAQKEDIGENKDYCDEQINDHIQSLKDDYGKAKVKPHPSHDKYCDIYGPIFTETEDNGEDAGDDKSLGGGLDLQLDGEADTENKDKPNEKRNYGEEVGKDGEGRKGDGGRKDNQGAGLNDGDGKGDVKGGSDDGKGLADAKAKEEE